LTAAQQARAELAAARAEGAELRAALERGQSTELAQAYRDLASAHREIARLHRLRRIVWPESGATLH
jgi:hypothetical protein